MLTSVDKVIKLIGTVIVFLFVLNFVTGGAISQVLRPLFMTNSSGSYDAGYGTDHSGFGSLNNRRTITLAEFPDLPATLQFGVIVSVLGVVIYVAAHLVVVVQAVLVSVPWAIVCFCLPPASFIYALLNFERCRLVLGGMIVGLIFSCLGWAVVTFG